MATHYTNARMEQALEQLGIQPQAERVTTSEAAKIWTWRAKKEYHVNHIYTANAVTKHKNTLDGQPSVKKDGTVNTRMNTYNVHKVFSHDIAPYKTNKGNKDAKIKGIDKVLTSHV